MKNEHEEKNTPEIEERIALINEQREQEKEEKLVNLIIEIIVSSTLRDYYEKSDKIPAIQSTRTK